MRDRQLGRDPLPSHGWKFSSIRTRNLSLVPVCASLHVRRFFRSRSVPTSRLDVAKGFLATFFQHRGKRRERNLPLFDFTFLSFVRRSCEADRRSSVTQSFDSTRSTAGARARLLPSSKETQDVSNPTPSSDSSLQDPSEARENAFARPRSFETKRCATRVHRFQDVSEEGERRTRIRFLFLWDREAISVSKGKDVPFRSGWEDGPKRRGGRDASTHGRDENARGPLPNVLSCRLQGAWEG